MRDTRDRLTALAVGMLTAATLAAQPVATPSAAAHDGLPFGVGERLVYGTRVARFGEIGQGTMWIEGPADVRGQPTYRLHFDFDAKVGLVRVTNRTESWLDAHDPRRLRALRFHKHERQPLSKHDQRVELHPDERRWDAADGSAGTTSTDAPLDELSYLYFIRTLPLVIDSTYRFDRHFEAERNPTTVRAVGREPVVTPAGTFQTLLVEMRVRDARRYKGDGVLWINLTDDACRIPVRIQSRMPLVGAAVLTLRSYTHGSAAP
ncbi:DUF3108 domain-containing protein [Roseisolibacter agri]|uniref:DUF3108 domain-containing protein n=1 Tax=Roseisolibacter agri TaxID=2014610 RepID=A0AA37Q1Y1_9BACT|nr:DUF3108 domain-containing protein [Roseisolibacter agri]GLC24879.1 hypothetical protein rosag_13920 [Roseisolibacter agri]